MWILHDLTVSSPLLIDGKLPMSVGGAGGRPVSFLFDRADACFTWDAKRSDSLLSRLLGNGDKKERVERCKRVMEKTAMLGREVAKRELERKRSAREAGKVVAIYESTSLVSRLLGKGNKELREEKPSA